MEVVSPAGSRGVWELGCYDGIVGAVWREARILFASENHMGVGQEVSDVIVLHFKTGSMHFTSLSFGRLIPYATRPGDKLVEEPSESHFPRGFGCHILDNENTLRGEDFWEGIEERFSRVRGDMVEDVEAVDAVPFFGVGEGSDIGAFEADILHAQFSGGTARHLDSFFGEVDAEDAAGWIAQGEVYGKEAEAASEVEDGPGGGNQSIQKVEDIDVDDAEPGEDIPAGDAAVVGAPDGSDEVEVCCKVHFLNSHRAIPSRGH